MEKGSTALGETVAILFAGREVALLPVEGCTAGLMRGCVLFVGDAAQHVSETGVSLGASARQPRVGCCPREGARQRPSPAGADAGAKTSLFLMQARHSGVPTAMEQYSPSPAFRTAIVWHEHSWVYSPVPWLLSVYITGNKPDLRDRCLSVHFLQQSRQNSWLHIDSVGPPKPDRAIWWTTQLLRDVDVKGAQVRQRKCHCSSSRAATCVAAASQNNTVDCRV